jgi:hypothetical protein
LFGEEHQRMGIKAISGWWSEMARFQGDKGPLGKRRAFKTSSLKGGFYPEGCAIRRHHVPKELNKQISMQSFKAATLPYELLSRYFCSQTI